MRVIQVSDTHISVKHEYFPRKTDLVLQNLKGLQADLFVHTGDLRSPETAITRRIAYIVGGLCRLSNT